jgi:AcrR family transcriptional regulator
MGITERKERQRYELRQQILDAARQIVIRDGYGALSMRRIADAIEYSPAAIYQYFENRDAIATAISREGFAALVAAFQPASTIADPRARLTAVARSYVQFGLGNPEQYRLMFMEDPKITKAALTYDEVDDPGVQAYAAIAGAIRHYLELRGKSASDERVTALADALWCTIHGIVSLKLTCPGYPQTAPDALVNTATSAFFDGIG